MKKLLALLFVGICSAQVSFPTTTLLGTIDKYYAGTIGLASAVALAPDYPGFAISTSGVGDPAGHNLIILMVDSEAMCQVAAPQGNYVEVIRGCQGTPTEGHMAGATVYIGPASWYLQNTPGGACVSQEQPALPRPVIPGGQLWNCVGNTWVPIGYALRPTAKPTPAGEIDRLDVLGFLAVVAIMMVALYFILRKQAEKEENG